MNEDTTPRFDGSIPLRDDQLACESVNAYLEKKEKGKSIDYKVDGSLGITGEFTVHNKNGAITLMTGLIEQFDINREDLDL